MAWRILLFVLPSLALAACGESVPADVAAGPLSGPLNEWKPQLAVVFPQHAPGDAKLSYAVNVSVWPTNRVLCGKDPNPRVSLYVSKNNEPGDFVQIEPALAKHGSGGAAFPTEEFDDVPANLVINPNAHYSFVAYVRGEPASNVWLHGTEPASGYAPVKPTGYASPDPAALDSIIQVVFPHDSHGKPAPAAKATALNIAVDLFQHGTTLSVAPDAAYKPELWLARGGAEVQVSTTVAQKTTYTVNGQGYPRWVFNDVQVQPGETYHLLATVGELGKHGGSYPTIWTHSGGAKPSAFKPTTPPPCIP
ncbi:MAG TPA: hypothetical protein VK009_01735 [Chloroflexota bacterium]|nr:hypothetical protein [Chloroflexota bacterium]